ncbi:MULTISPECIES: YebC/PmpR family DNA-binding transcriptional regulator [Rheinheimera]|uniref:Probable transcriptional regulatory protein ACFO3I_06885 n=1 Tax=Rheinheimera marina TaxID=1774958 RepID=A0ABV9JKG0_9GAMM
MAGHSKWANMKHRKARQDAKKVKIFTKIIRELTVAAKFGADPAGNPRLRSAIAKAMLNNLSRDVMDRAIKRGAGDSGGENFEELTYEGYGPNGVAIIVETLTDNLKRTVQDVRSAFTKYGGNLGTNGSVSYLFAKKGVFSFAPGVSEDQLMDVALDAGADDVVTHDDGSFEVFTAPEAFVDVNEALEAAGLNAEHAEVTMVPSTKAVIDADTVQKFFKLIDMLEDFDDVQNVYHNADIADEVMALVD